MFCNELPTVAKRKCLNLEALQHFSLKGGPLPTPNYAFAKRQRDLAKKAKKEEKLKRKADGAAQTNAPEEPTTPTDQADAPAVNNGTP
jgi:hypothetical protein